MCAGFSPEIPELDFFWPEIVRSRLFKSPHHRMNPNRKPGMATTLTTSGSVPYPVFSYCVPIRDDAYLYDPTAKTYFKEQSRHIENETDSHSALMAIEVLKGQKVTRKNEDKNGLRVVTHLRLQCNIMFPNSITPRKSIIQFIKEGEQDFYMMNGENFYIGVRGNFMSHFMTDHDGTKNNLIYTQSNSLDFYSQGKPGSKQPTNLQAFSHDFFVLDSMPMPTMNQQVSVMTAKILLNTFSIAGYNESAMFHVGDLFARSSAGLIEMYKTHATVCQKRKLRENGAAEANAAVRSRQNPHIQDSGILPQSKGENVLDISKYVFHEIVQPAAMLDYC